MPQKILVTDDSPTVLEIMRQVLSDAGYNVITAVDGQEAVDKAKTEKPDLIILDLMLPKIDGYKVCAMLKFNKAYQNIPVILLTARTGDSDIEMGREVKADAYIVKPFEPETLILKIRSLLEKRTQDET